MGVNSAYPYEVAIPRGMVSESRARIHWWITRYIGRSYESEFYPSKSLFRFLTPEDALAFKMRWY